MNDKIGLIKWMGQINCVNFINERCVYTTLLRQFNGLRGS